MLQTTRLTKHFRGLSALNSLDLVVEQGEIVGLVGPNGAGKTTTFNLVTGFLAPTSGTICFEGRDITGKSPHAIASRGIVRTFQLDRIFHNYTVLQNVVAAHHMHSGVSMVSALLGTASYRRKMHQVESSALEVLDLLGIVDLQSEPARNLSHGHQRLLGIAIALSARPRLLLLDEPLAGMDAADIARTLQLILRIRAEGTAVLLIEHNMQAVMKICERLLVLDFGTTICQGTCQEVVENEAVIRAYLGEALPCSA